jgi:hypothetical protein
LSSAGVARRGRTWKIVRRAAPDATPPRWTMLACAEPLRRLMAWRGLAGGGCGAYARTTGRACGNAPMPGKKRCRMHGGLSTGPTTDEGRAAIAASNRGRAHRATRKRAVV